MKFAALAVLTAGAFLLASCESDPTGTTEAGQVSLGVTGAPDATSSLLASSVRADDPEGRSIVIESFRIVVFEIEMEVKPVEGNESEEAFESQHPGWPLSQSIKVTGTFDADDGEGPQPFDIFLDFNDDFELEIEPPLEIGEGESPTRASSWPST